MMEFKGKSILNVANKQFLRSLITECDREDITNTFQYFIDNNTVPLTFIKTDNPPFKFSFRLDSITKPKLIDIIKKISPKTSVFRTGGRIYIEPHLIPETAYIHLLNVIYSYTTDEEVEVELFHPIKKYSFGIIAGSIHKEENNFFLLGEYLITKYFEKPKKKHTSEKFDALAWTFLNPEIPYEMPQL